MRFSCDQAVLWKSCLCVYPSHISTMFPSSYHHELFKRNYHWQNWWMSMQNSRSALKVTDVKKTTLPKFGCCRTVAPIWIHRWLQNDTKGLKWHRSGALLSSVKFWVTRGKHLAIRSSFKGFWTITEISNNRLLWNDAQIFRGHRRGVLCFSQNHPSNFKVTRAKKSPIGTDLGVFGR